MKKSWLFVLAVAMVTAMCTHDPVTPEEPTPVLPGPDTLVLTPCGNDSIYFEQQLLPVFQTNCATSGCHDAASARRGVILDSYANIIATGGVQPGDPANSNLYQVLIAMNDFDRMPPPPANPLPPVQIQAVERWILEGARNTSCDPSPCDLSNTAFQATIDPILTRHCKSCHNARNPSGGISLETYAEIKAEVDRGALVGSMDHQPGWSPMPKGGNKIPACEIEQVKQWVNNGARNN